MSNRIGSSTIYHTTLPNNAALNRVRSVKLSRAAKFRLTVIEHYLTVTKNVSLTCRHFAIARSYFYKWYQRFNPGHLATLEDRSRRPKRVRQATYDHRLVSLVRRLRTDYPRFSSKKLAVILHRDYDLGFSAATIGRIIQRYKLYFSRTVRLHVHRHGGLRSWVTRKPYDLRAQGPRTLIEFDMKHIRTENSRKRYAFVAVDVVTKQAVIHVSASSKSSQAKVALERAVATFGTSITVLNDNGSENFQHAHDYLKEQKIPQYFARPIHRKTNRMSRILLVSSSRSVSTKHGRPTA